MVSLYIHLPFCAQKCSYCDFVSFAGAQDKIDGYISALLSEAEEYKGEKVHTLFIGGGTPSLLSPFQLERLMHGLFRNFEMSHRCEATIEANPNSLNRDKLLSYANMGINRLSIGLQSTVDSELKLLNRLHTYEEFLSCYEMAVKYFNNINIDLISGLPGQTAEAFELSLKRAAALKPQHISAYSLIPEAGTPLGEKIARGELKMPDEDCDRLIYHRTGKLLSQRGYNRYEISNYCLTGFECRHNMAYWTGEDYIGLGCAAHSLFKSKRSAHTGNLEEYLAAPHRMNEYTLTDKDKYEEYLMLRLRLTDGFSFDDFQSRFGYRLQERKGGELAQMEAAGFITTAGGVALTAKGLDVCDSIVLKLI